MHQGLVDNSKEPMEEGKRTDKEKTLLMIRERKILKTPLHSSAKN